MNKSTLFIMVFALLMCQIPIVCLNNTNVDNVRLMFPTSEPGYFDFQSVEDRVVQRFSLLSSLRGTKQECLIDVDMRQKTFDALLHFNASEEHTIDQLHELAQAATYLQDQEQEDDIYKKLARELSQVPEDVRCYFLQESPYREKLAPFLRD